MIKSIWIAVLVAVSSGQAIQSSGQIPEIGKGRCYKANKPKPIPPKPIPKPVPKPSTPKPKPSTPKIGGYVAVAGDADGCIAQHNQVRTGLGLNPLAWDSTLAQSADRWANHLNVYNLGMTHSSGVGENLYRGGSGECSGAMKAWVTNERPLYRVGSAIGTGDFHGNRFN